MHAQHPSCDLKLDMPFGRFSKGHVYSKWVCLIKNGCGRENIHASLCCAVTVSIFQLATSVITLSSVDVAVHSGYMHVATLMLFSFPCRNVLM